MTPPRFLIFTQLNGQLLTWSLTDSVLANFPATGATVKATLFKDRSLVNGLLQPGTAVDHLTDLTLDEDLPSKPGTYSAEVDATFNPDVGANYVLVVDATHVGYESQHWEMPAMVKVRLN